MALDPLKFQVAIEGDAIAKLDEIQEKLNGLKNAKTSVNLTGISSDDASKLGTSFAIIATAIEKMKQAIQGNDFATFNTQINGCADAISKLTKEFDTFQGVVGQNEGLKNFMEGLGSVVHSVKQTINGIEGAKINLTPDSTNVYAQNVQRMEEALAKIQQARVTAGNALFNAPAGMDVSQIRMYLTLLSEYEAKLKDIKADSEMMAQKGWQSEAFGLEFKHLIGNAKGFEQAVKRYKDSVEEQRRADIKEADDAISAEERKKREIESAWAEQEKKREELRERQEKSFEQAEQKRKESLYKAAEEEAKAQQKAEEERIKAANKADEQMTAQKQKQAEERKKAAEKAAEAEQKAAERTNKVIQNEIDKASSEIKKLEVSIKRGEDAGRDMSVLSDAKSRLLGQQWTVQSMTPEDRKSIDYVEKRLHTIRETREETELLRKAEERLTTAKEQEKKQKDRAETKQLNDEIQSVRDASVKYQELQAKIRELQALRDRGITANIDISSIDEAIAKYEELRRAIFGVISSDGRTGSGQLTKEYVADESYKKNIIEAKEKTDEFTAALNEKEKRMRTAQATADNLGKYIDSIEAKKIDFEGLDTSRLDAAVQKIHNVRVELENFAKTGVSAYGETSNEIVHNLGLAEAKHEVATATANLNKESKAAAASTRQATDEEKQFAAALKEATSEGKSHLDVLRSLKSLAAQYLGVWGAQGFLNNIIQIGGQLESQRLSLTAILGKASYANDLYSKVQGLAIKSPFGVVQLDQYTKNLSAYGFQYNELFDMTKRLADIAAGTGTDFGRLALALGHVRSEMALTGYTLRQFSMANVPMLRMLAKNLGVTTTEIRKMVRSKEVSYKDVENVLRELTNEGGMFYNMQETMSEAVSAKFKNLKDSMDIMYGQMAESGIGDLLKSIAAGLMRVTTHWQSAATAIGTAAAMMSIYKLAQMAVNAGVKAQTTGLLANNLMLKSKTAEEVNSIAVSGLLTKETLVHAVATKKLTFEQAKLAAVTLGVDEALLKELASMTALEYGTKGLMSKLGAMLTNPWTVAMVAISAVMGAVAEYRSWVKGLEDDADAYIDNQKTAAKEISDYLKTASKPTNERELVGVNEEMKDILKNAGLYTSEIEHQIDGTKTLADEYDALISKMQEANDVLTKNGITAKDIAESVKSTGSTHDMQQWVKALGGPITGNIIKAFMNDGIMQNMEDLSSAQMEVRKAIGKIGKDSLSQGVDTVLKSGVLSESEIKEIVNYPLEEQLRLLIQNKKAWRMLINEANDGSKDFGKNAKELGESLRTTTTDWEEITENDVPKIVDKMKETLGEGFNDPALRKAFIDGIINPIKDKSPELADTLRRALLSAADGEFEFQLAQRLETAVEKAARLAMERQEQENKALKDIGSQGKRGGVFGYMRNMDSTIPADWISKRIGYSLGKSDADIESAIISERKKVVAEMASARKFGDADVVAEKALEKKRLDALVRYFGFSDKSSGGDKNAKALRERVRILKEAEESYQYWRKQVGGAGAESHVGKEFGKLLNELGYTFQDIEQFRQSLLNLREEYEKKPKSKEMLEALKELDKVLADIDRKDFEKNSEEALSSMKLQIEDLTRAMDIFNSVLEGSGDVGLAERVSGISYGLTEADLKKAAVSQTALTDIDFDSVLGMSDEAIDRYVEGLGIAEEEIKAVQEGLKEWKKAQQGVEKNDLVDYARYLGSLVDLENIRKRNQGEYNNALLTTQRMLKNGQINQEEKSRRDRAAKIQMDSKNWQATAAYYELYNNAQDMAAKDFAKAYATEVDNLKDQMEAGLITAEDYAEKMANLQRIMSDFGGRGFLGINGGLGAYLGGGTSGLTEYLRSRATSLRLAGREDEAKKEEQFAKSLEKAKKAGDDVAAVFGRISTVAELLADMFDALGMVDAANAFADAGSVLSGIEGGADALSAFGIPGMAAGAVIGGVTAVAKVHDERLSRQIEKLNKEAQRIRDNTEIIKMFRERSLGYDRGAMKWRSAAATFKRGGELYVGYDNSPDARREMYKYYLNNSMGSGYAQEYANLLAERQKVIESLNNALNKNKAGDEIEEYKKQIAELDEQILFFSEDLSKALWGMDLKGWADQISDALMSAFENGENAAKAYDDTVRNIMQNVASEILKIGILEPMMEHLRTKLFGKIDENGVRQGGLVSASDIADDPLHAAEKLVLATNEYFAGEGRAMLTAAQEFYAGINDALTQGGLVGGLRNPNSSGTLSASVQGIKEETADLLSGYVNALRQDVAANRILLTQFATEMWPEYIEAFTSNVRATASIDTNVQVIMMMMQNGNGRMFEEISAIKSHFDNITSNIESVSIR